MRWTAEDATAVATKLRSRSSPDPSSGKQRRIAEMSLVRVIRFVPLWVAWLGFFLPPGRALAVQEDGIPMAVTSIHVVGAEGIPESRVQESMRLRPATFWRRVRGSEAIEYDPLKMALDLRAIRYLYQQEGFLRAEITDHEAGVDSVAREVDIVVTVEEGSRYHFGSINLEGIALSEEEAVRFLVKSRPGAPANLHQVRDDATALRNHYRNRGHVAAVVHFETVPNDETDRVDVNFVVRPGGPHAVAAIEVTGNKITQQAIVTRELGMAPGDLFSLDQVRRDQQELYNTGLFSGVKITEVDVDTVAQTVGLEVSVIERKPRWVSVGVGSSSDDRENFRLTAEWGHKNLLGTARLVSLRSLGTWKLEDLLTGEGIEPVATRHEIGYLQPWFAGHRFRVGGTVFYAREIPLASDGEVLRTWGVTGRILRELDLHTEVSLEPRLQWANESAEGVIADQAVSQTNSVTLLLRRDTRENIFDPRRGGASIGALTNAGGILGGDFSYWKATFNLSGHWEGPSGRIYAGRIMGGMIDPYEDSGVPTEERFILGGSNTLRGYEEGGVHTGEGDGEILALANLEVRQPLVGYLGAAAFVDVGQVWPYWSAVSLLSDLRWTVGGEIRYQLPIGPVRVGYGVRLHEADRDGPELGGWFFGFGQVF